MNIKLSLFASTLTEKPLNHKRCQEGQALLASSTIWASANKKEVTHAFIKDFKKVAIKCSEKMFESRDIDGALAQEIIACLAPLLLSIHHIAPIRYKKSFLKSIFFTLEEKTRTQEKSSTTKLITSFMLYYEKINGEPLELGVMNEMITSLYSASPPRIYILDNTPKRQKHYFKTLYHNNDYLLSKKIITKPFEHFSADVLVSIYQSAFKGYHTIFNTIMNEIDDLSHGPSPNEEVKKFISSIPINKLKEMVKLIKKGMDYDPTSTPTIYSPFLDIVQLALNQKMVELEKNNLSKAIPVSSSLNGYNTINNSQSNIKLKI